jgi:hypothetical protein
MVDVPDEIRETFTQQRVIPLATCSADGAPNVAYVGMWWWENPETLVVVNNYMNKTLENLEENPRASLVTWVRDDKGSRSYQIKCRTENHFSGPLFEKGRLKATSGKLKLPGRSVIVCLVEEVYSSSSGKGAGDRLI